MKFYALDRTIKALIFDMDKTLYTSAEYVSRQAENLSAIVAERRGLTLAEIEKEIEEARKNWMDSHGGSRPSFSNIILSWGFTMEENVRWREEACVPEDYLKKDPKLRETLLALRSLYKLGVITNNPVSIAKRTFACLGIENCFDALIGLDTCMIAKPHEEPFKKISRDLGVSPEYCVSIGDRYDIDLAVPLKMGMGGILVNGIEDVYSLKGTL
jgi:phosphoglycolate phosphatase/putative hydrolase of the HAD superfamily